MDNNEKAILTTLIYSNIFDYPLTKQELWEYALTPSSLNKKEFFTTLTTFPHCRSKRQYYFLPGAEAIVQIRLNREAVAKKKLFLAKKTARILSIIPTIQFIGISGSLSMNNTQDEDDIDLVIITRQHSIWVTRFCIFIMLEIFRKRRKRGSRQVNDKICVNLLLEESSLALSPRRQNIYTAHEIIQVKALFDCNNMHQRFLLANPWVKKFMPHALSRIKGKKYQKPYLCRDVALQRLYRWLNSLAKCLQLWYMKGQHSSEIISDTVLAFYQSATQQRILGEYEKGLRQYNISNV